MEIDVLLVEDSLGDIRLTFEAFREVNPRVTMHTVWDGAEAMAFLRREDIYSEAPRPSLILLDLNIPKMNGCEVLAAIKTDKKLLAIPVIMLTTSLHEKDIETAYALQANCYLHKPRFWDEFVPLMRSINDFWLTNINMPKQPTSTAFVESV